VSLCYFSKVHPKQDTEDRLSEVKFNIFKFNNRPKPRKKDRILIIGCFSEFGCEVMGAMYCIPRLLKRYPGRYIIAAGWYGREYLYHHLVDEFWEIDEKYMWLREHTRAFHNISKNIYNIEDKLNNFGTVIPSISLGRYAIGNFCQSCGFFWNGTNYTEKCYKCKSTFLVRSVFSDISYHKKKAARIPKPSKKALDWAKEIIQPNTVGIFARNRKCYGRNLDAYFYKKLIFRLKKQNYNIIWLGEKQTSLPCPVEDIMDFSYMSESRDLEKTLAIICQLKFTIQFWTASSRLSGIMGVPFLLFESPEQVYNIGFMGGQEGFRLELTTFGPKKLAICHYLNVCENEDKALGLIEQCVGEMEEGNYKDVIGLVRNKEVVKEFQESYYGRIR